MIATGLAAIALAVAAPGAGQTVSSAPLANTQLADPQAEAQAQAICMQGNDFRRAYEAFVAKERPVFEGD